MTERDERAKRARELGSAGAEVIERWRAQGGRYPDEEPAEKEGPTQAPHANGEGGRWDREHMAGPDPPRPARVGVGDLDVVTCDGPRCDRRVTRSSYKVGYARRDDLHESAFFCSPECFLEWATDNPELRALTS